MDSDGARSTGPDQEIAGTPGTVVEQLPSALYRVRLDAGSMVTAHIGGRVDRNFVRILVGDRVAIAISPVDGGRGRIVRKLEVRS